MTVIGERRELESFLERHPEIEVVEAIYSDLCNLWRGKRLERVDAGKLYDRGLPVAGAMFLIDVTGETCDPGGRGYSDGDPDHLARPVADSLVPIPWSKRPAAQVLMNVFDLDGQPYDASPRNILERIAARIHGHGWRPMIAAELEFYLIDVERAPDGAPQPPILPGSGERASSRQVYSMADLDGYGDFFDAVSKACAAQNIPANVASSEYAPGQLEINLKHIDSPVLAADHAVLLQRVVTSLAKRYGMQATFMAKPFPAEEGSGLHYHVSLPDEDGNNLFDDGSQLGSDTLRHAIGGMGVLAAESMAIFAPNINAYRRFGSGSYGGGAFSWGDNNRTVSVRLPVGDGPAKRLEHRMAGADANPYLTLAAVLAGLEYGIVNRTDPGPPQQGADRPSQGDVPQNWRDALDAMERSERLVDYLGRDYIDLYVATKRGEMERFLAQASPLEYSWYLGTG
jgi:glutamine synthetase